MKRLSSITILFIVALIAGCSKMDDTYREFIGDGETVYIAKADSIHVRGGNNRLEISWLLISDPKVHQYKVYWNNRQDSIESTVTKTDDVDTVRLVLDNMAEGVHHFEIFMFDKHGNSSINAQTTGTVYGERYESSLLNRTYRGIRRIGTDLEIDWMPAESSLEEVEVKYIGLDGEMVTHIVPKEVELDTLRDFPANGEFEYRSVFLPNPTALDVFYAEDLSNHVDDDALRMSNMSFGTTVRYGSQEDQLAVLVSTNFNGEYDGDDIQAATWIDITEAFPLASGSSSTPWGPQDFSDLIADNQPIYIAFRYTTLPQDENGKQRTWSIRDFELTSASGNRVDLSGAEFILIHEGPFEPNRSSISSETITLRGNSEDTESQTVDWAISKAIF